MQLSLDEQKQQLVEHYRWLRQYGCNDSHSGNASLRWYNQVWVTPTGCCADTLQADDLVFCDMNGNMDADASLDAPLHIEVYCNNDKVRAVFHSHGPHVIALTLSGEDFVPVDFEGQYYFPTVPVVTIDYDRYVELSPKAVAEQLAQYKVTVLTGHGVYAAAETINLAYKWSCSVEFSAKTALLAKQLNHVGVDRV